MVSRLQSLFHAGRIELAPSAEVTAMMEELLAYRVKVSDDGHDSYNAKVGDHDDLVVALGLATLLDQGNAGAGSIDYLAIEHVI